MKSSCTKICDVDRQEIVLASNGITIEITDVSFHFGDVICLNTPEFANVATTSTPDLGVCYCRFGHLNHDYVNRLAKKQLVVGMIYSDVRFDKECEACALGKMHKLPSTKQSMNRASKPLELIHTDLCGPMNVDSIGGSLHIHG